MTTSRVEYAVPNTDPSRKSCSAHGSNSSNEALWMLVGKGVTYPACQSFLNEHPEIMIRDQHVDRPAQRGPREVGRFSSRLRAARGGDANWLGHHAGPVNQLLDLCAYLLDDILTLNMEGNVKWNPYVAVALKPEGGSSCSFFTLKAGP